MTENRHFLAITHLSKHVAFKAEDDQCTYLCEFHLLKVFRVVHFVIYLSVSKRYVT